MLQYRVNALRLPDADDHKLDLLHPNVRKYGTIYNTVAVGTRLEGRIVRQ